MSAVMINCPETGAPLHTGMHAHWVDFNRMPDIAREITCPACRRIHTWSRSQAWLVDPGRGQPLPSAPIVERTLRLVG